MQTSPEQSTTPVVAQVNGLPTDRSRWPADASDSYRQILRDLDRWSRENNFPLATNAWVAEEAVRQGWQS